MSLLIEPVEGIGEVAPGDDLASMLAEALRPMAPADTDVLVVTHKVVSKAEGAVVELADDGPDAHRALVEEQAVRVLRRRGNLVIAETRHGFVCANAGVDRSNARPGTAVLLPEDPDRSARRIRDRIGAVLGVRPAVIISDTFGRPWRRGLVDVAIGVAGMHPIQDLRGTPDSYGRILDVTEVNVADEIAAAADLVMGKASGLCAALVRGFVPPPGPGSVAQDVVRPPEEDLFR
ncbi:MAG: coenzyme F420-0:L-glutamate ligase [Actinomycetes bacterium]|jgi:coenzyme F420-0:L-glutamate ligase/coenzyme F420-1:gamma-L-glutamate ligase|nr:coenzyme F420-0:L-glutamate ligase [Acidimicrobiia bacterium]